MLTARCSAPRHAVERYLSKQCWAAGRPKEQARTWERKTGGSGRLSTQITPKGLPERYERRLASRGWHHIVAVRKSKSRMEGLSREHQRGRAGGGDGDSWRIKEGKQVTGRRSAGHGKAL